MLLSVKTWKNVLMLLIDQNKIKIGVKRLFCISLLSVGVLSRKSALEILLPKFKQTNGNYITRSGMKPAPFDVENYLLVMGSGEIGL